jgi:NitT/TauT family transport system permease protein
VAVASLRPKLAAEPTTELTSPESVESRARAWAARFRRPTLQVLSIAIFLLVWAGVASLDWAIRIPSPLDVLGAAVAIDKHAFLKDMGLSFYRVMLGFVIAGVIGIPLGIAIGFSPLIRNLVFPPVEFLRPVPPIAWIPLAILFFPQQEWMIVFLTFYGAFFPIVYNTIAGVAGIPRAYVRAGKSLGAGRWKLFWHVTLPAMLPSVFTGLHVAIGIAWLMVVAGEMMATQGGVGAMTWEAYQTTRYPLIFVGMATIGVLGYASSVVIRLFARTILRWEER